MPNFSGFWTVTQQMQARGASTWPAPPGAPTIGTATSGGALCASVTFTAPACTGYPSGGITGYRVISTPGCVSITGASSPLVVTGLTANTSYTFKAQATNNIGYGCLSAASNSMTALARSSQSYIINGTYSWVAPACVTSVSVVAVGAGGAGGTRGTRDGGGGGGGSLAYKNNITVVSGNSYVVVVGLGGVTTGNTAQNGGNGGASSFTAGFGTMTAGGGVGGLSTGGVGTGGVRSGTYDGGGSGGNGGQNNGASGNAGAGGGAGGYAGSGGAGGGGGGGRIHTAFGNHQVAGGGGVGILGQGSSGAAGTNCATLAGGGGGSGGAQGANGSCTQAANSGNGGAYGGGSGGNGEAVGGKNNGGVGAIRIIWPGNTRSFPSTCAGSP